MCYFGFESGQEYQFEVGSDGVIDFKYHVEDANEIFPVQVFVMDGPDVKRSTELAYATINLTSGGAGQKSQLHAELQFSSRIPN